MADENDTDEAEIETNETDKTLGVDEGIDDLKAKLAAAEARANAAEARASTAASQVDLAQDEVQRSNLTVITGAIEQLNGRREQLKADYANHMAAGDFAAAAGVNSEMADVATKLFSLENGKVAIETAPKREARRAAATSSDPVERNIAQWGLSPKSADWVRRHPEYATDDAKTKKMVLADNMAVLNDLERESPEYFAFVEKTLGIGHTDQRREPAGDVAVKDVDATSAAAAPVRRRDAAPPPAAPASRGNSNGRIRTLTAAQAEAAKISNMTNEEYAKQLERLARDKPN